MILHEIMWLHVYLRRHNVSRCEILWLYWNMRCCNPIWNVRYCYCTVRYVDLICYLGYCFRIEILCSNLNCKGIKDVGTCECTCCLGYVCYKLTRDKKYCYCTKTQDNVLPPEKWLIWYTDPPWDVRYHAPTWDVRYC